MNAFSIYHKFLDNIIAWECENRKREGIKISPKETYCNHPGINNWFKETFIKIHNNKM